MRREKQREGWDLAVLKAFRELTPEELSRWDELSRELEIEWESTKLLGLGTFKSAEGREEL
jgi:hypothetical protein